MGPYGVNMGTYLLSLTHMGPDGSKWIHMAYIWVDVGPYESIWFIWVNMNPSVHIWAHMDPYGAVWVNGQAGKSCETFYRYPMDAECFLKPHEKHTFFVF